MHIITHTKKKSSFRQYRKHTHFGWTGQISTRINKGLLMSELDDLRDSVLSFSVSRRSNTACADPSMWPIEKAAWLKNSPVSPERSWSSTKLENVEYLEAYGSLIAWKSVFYFPDKYWSNKDGRLGGWFALNADRRPRASEALLGQSPASPRNTEMDLFGIRAKGAESLSFSLTQLPEVCTDCTETHTHTQ